MDVSENPNLAAQIAQKREFGTLVCQKITACLEKIGFPAEVVLSYPDYDAAQFVLIKDPLSGQFNLSGTWYDSRKQKLGQLQFQSDDSCYAEYTAGLAHPKKPRWFVDNVTAWGNQDDLKAEANLLRFPE